MVVKRKTEIMKTDVIREIKRQLAEASAKLAAVRLATGGKAGR